MNIKVIALVLFSEVWNAAGQVFYKMGANQLEPEPLANLQAYGRFIRKVLAIPSIWIGLAMMGIGLTVWLAALAQGDLSFVFPVGSAQYVLTLLSASLFLGERINAAKLTGTLLVMVGILFIAVS